MDVAASQEVPADQLLHQPAQVVGQQHHGQDRVRRIRHLRLEDVEAPVVEGEEGPEDDLEITPINSKDVLYTLTDSAMVEIIAYGRPNYGMNPFGLAYGGELTRTEIDHMVTFMRYAWDDRFEMPEIKPLFPPLAEGEVPSYEVHIAPIVKRYCVSCHREGKDNNDFLMTTYDEILTTGENVEFNLITGDHSQNYHILSVIDGHQFLQSFVGHTAFHRHKATL